MLEDKDMQIEALQKKMKLFVTDHPQDEEILVIQNKHDALKDEVLDLKAKLLPVTQEKDQLFQGKEELMRKSTVEVSTNNPQLINIEELTRSLAQVSLKDQKISELKEENKSLEKANK